MAYMLQIACITLLAELVLRVVPVSSAGFRYAYWRLVLAGALVTPWLLRVTPAPTSPDVVEPLASGSLGVGILELSEATTEWTAGSASTPDLVPWILAAGVVARILWVAAGVGRLRGLRRSGVALVDPAYHEIQQMLGTRAELRAVPDLAQPVTFGVRRPVVLLPHDLEASPSLRRAVVTHELVHVQRRDWLWVMSEEALRAVLWFHPAIWWLTSRIQQSREEFTDHVAVLATGSRRAYIDALLSFAEGGRLQPAPAFARRAHLFHRIVTLSKEAAMSSRRIVVSGAVIAALLVMGSWYTSGAFPVMEAAATAVLPVATPSAADAPLAAPVQPAPAPVPAMASRSTSAAPRPARQAVAANQPLYPITPENPIPRRVFSTPVPYPIELAGSGFQGAVEMRVVLNAGGSISSVTRTATSVSNTPQGSVEERQRAIEAFVTTTAASIKQWQYDPPARAPIAFYVAATFTPGAAAATSQSETSRGVSAGATRIVRPVVAPPDGGPVRVGGAVMAPARTRHVEPFYPEIARSARVQGVVILEVVIDEQGRVTSARVLRSIPLLDAAALDAVKQWEYTPTLLNGAPVPVIMTVTVQFTL